LFTKATRTRFKYARGDDGGSSDGCGGDGAGARGLRARTTMAVIQRLSFGVLETTLH
jgi:hypothetical protein